MKIEWPASKVIWISFAIAATLVMVLSFIIVLPMYGKYSSREHLGTMILAVLISPLRDEIESNLLSSRKIDILNPTELMRADLMPSWSDYPLADRITISSTGEVAMYNEKFNINVKLTPELSEGKIVWFCSGTPASLFIKTGCSKHQNTTDITAAIADSSFSQSLNFKFSEQWAVVKKGSTGTFNFSLPGSIPINIALFTEPTTLNVIFTTPTGVVLESGVGVEIKSGQGPLGEMIDVSLDADHAVSGLWKATYSVTYIDPLETESEIVILVKSDSDHSLAGTVLRYPEFLRINQTGTISASLLDGTTPVQGAEVVVILPSGSINLVESKNSQGVYEAPVTETVDGTHYGDLIVKFGGVTSQATVFFKILPDSVLGSTFEDQGVSNSKNGLYDFLDIAVPVSLENAQSGFAIGVLRTSSGKTISSKTLFDLGAGSGVFHLQFDGNAIFKTGDSGPYILESIRLHFFEKSGSSKLVDVLEPAYYTKTYPVNSFQKQVR